MTVNGKPLNTGDFLHILQIALLVGAMGMAYQQFQEFKTQVQGHTVQLNRVEHYLSSRDPRYWEFTRKEE